MIIAYIFTPKYSDILRCDFLLSDIIIKMKIVKCFKHSSLHVMMYEMFRSRKVGNVSDGDVRSEVLSFHKQQREAGELSAFQSLRLYRLRPLWENLPYFICHIDRSTNSV